MHSFNQSMSLSFIVVIIWMVLELERFAGSDRYKCFYVGDSCFSDAEEFIPNLTLTLDVAGEQFFYHIFVEGFETEQGTHHSANDAGVGVGVACQGDHLPDRLVVGLLFTSLCVQ